MNQTYNNTHTDYLVKVLYLITISSIVGLVFFGIYETVISILKTLHDNEMEVLGLQKEVLGLRKELLSLRKELLGLQETLQSFDHTPNNPLDPFFNYLTIFLLRLIFSMVLPTKAFNIPVVGTILSLFTFKGIQRDSPPLGDPLSDVLNEVARTSILSAQTASQIAELVRVNDEIGTAVNDLEQMVFGLNANASQTATEALNSILANNPELLRSALRDYMNQPSAPRVNIDASNILNPRSPGEDN